MVHAPVAERSAVEPADERAACRDDPHHGRRRDDAVTSTMRRVLDSSGQRGSNADTRHHPRRACVVRLFALATRRFGGSTRFLATAAKAFIPVWLIAAAINIWAGVS